ncbi:MAG TPA: prolyl oligopeptidase family serine peptidase, partial [Bryobacteraceae bacterium]|nr:prolyl oligopeptidase family serine peptidase [Bryobacteraceae bacterium]
MRHIFVLLAAASGCVCQTAPVRPVPPPGVAVPDNDRTELSEGLDRLGRNLELLRGHALLADVQVFHEAVRVALKYGEFFKPEEIGRAKELLRQGQTRAADLLAGRAPWATSTGLVVRGYISKIDRSPQPYALVVPPSWSPTVPRRWRLDFWFHGRAETLSEVNFLYDRQRQPGEFTPADTLVLHLYGRHNNANKFAGEVDLFEALEEVRRHYQIDENRLVVRGFSMGGAAAWQFATHFAGLWAAAAPGAGFSETPEFLNIAKDPVKPSWWEEKLWHMYNATDYAANLYNTPVVAYSGEIDRQKQAADAMEKAMAAEGMRLTHII